MHQTELHPSPLSVCPVFGGDLDLSRWTAAHRSGLVPDAVPYGLDRMEAHGVRLVPAPPGWSTSPAGRRLRGAVRRGGGGFDWALVAAGRPPGDVVLSWDERAGVPLALAHGRHVPVVVNVIWMTDAPPRRSRHLVGAALRRAARVTTLSSGQVPALVDRLGIPVERVSVIPFGVDVDFFTVGGQDRDPDHVVSVGNDRDRDWPTVLRAFATVRRHRPRSRLTIVSRTVGARAQGIEGVDVVPRLDHEALRSLLRNASAALVLTRPNLHVSGITAALEAQAVGLPVVASRTPGMVDYAPRDGGLRLVPTGDAEAAAREVLELLSDSGAAHARGRQGRRDVVGRFSTAVQASHLARVVREAAAA